MIVGERIEGSERRRAPCAADVRRRRWRVPRALSATAPAAPRAAAAAPSTECLMQRTAAPSSSSASGLRRSRASWVAPCERPRSHSAAPQMRPRRAGAEVARSRPSGPNDRARLQRRAVAGELAPARDGALCARSPRSEVDGSRAERGEAGRRPLLPACVRAEQGAQPRMLRLAALRSARLVAPRSPAARAPPSDPAPGARPALISSAGGQQRRRQRVHAARVRTVQRKRGDRGGGWRAALAARRGVILGRVRRDGRRRGRRRRAGRAPAGRSARAGQWLAGRGTELGEARACGNTWRSSDPIALLYASTALPSRCPARPTWPTKTPRRLCSSCPRSRMRAACSATRTAASRRPRP